MKRPIKQNLLSRSLKFILLFALLRISFVQAQTVNVKSGNSSIDVTVNAPSSGAFYYSLYNASQTGVTAAKIKTDAAASPSGSLVRGGKVTVTSTLVNTALNKLITNLPDNTTYYLYLFFENSSGVAGSVTSLTAALGIRQQSLLYTYNTKTNVYALYKPEAYVKDQSNKTFPLLIACHGDGQKGTRNFATLITDGLPQAIQEGYDYDFIVASPQINGYEQMWTDPAFLNSFLEGLKLNYRIDLNRVYITGLSGGGGGLYTLASNQPGKIAAVVPVGAVNAGSIYCALKNVPLYGFHNQNDPTVGVGNLYSAISGIYGCGTPLVAPDTTIYPQSGHGGWYQTYRNYNTFKWILGNSKNLPTNQPPVLSASSTTVNVNASAASVTLSVTANDPDGNNSLLVYEWYKLKGPDITAKALNGSSVELSDLKAGQYIFRSLVKDETSKSNFIDITVNVTGSTNVAPTVSITAPANNSTITAGTAVNVTANAADSDGLVTGVAFYANNVLIGSDNTSPYAITWTPSTAATYALKAVATDNSTATTNSSIVNVTVTSSGNTVTAVITEPAENQNYSTGTPVVIRVTPTTTSGTITSVKFYKVTGTTSTYFGEDTYPPFFYTIYPAQLSAGANKFTVTAFSSTGGSGSDEVNFTVGAPRFGFEEGQTGEVLETILPNPAREYLDISAWKEGDDYTVTNSMGEQVAEGKQSKVHVGHLANGVYFLRHNNTIHKFVKE